MKNNNILITGLLFLFVLSCTGDDLSDSNSITSIQTLDAWMEKNKPDVPKYKEGFYLSITHDPNITKSNPPVDTSVVGISYCVKTLDGNYVANTNAQTARILGKFSNKTNYVPFTFVLKYYYHYNGMNAAIYEALKTMSKGDTAEMYLSVGWAYGGNKVDSIYLGFTGNRYLPAGKIVHISLTLDSIVNKPLIAQEYLISDYVKAHFSKESIPVKKGIYKDILVENNIAKDTIPSDTSLMIDYIGYLPNGFVFDTSLKGIAEERRIYNPSSKYKPITYTYNRRDTSNYSGMIKAWRHVISTMKLGEQAIFIADASYCYGNSGKYEQNATLLPVYTPLIFFIHVLSPAEAAKREEDLDE
ncbi:MAG: FKBP-type peptidyl-prolyl cis-trans isomerase [Rikenellaceae bacterium]